MAQWIQTEVRQATPSIFKSGDSSASSYELAAAVGGVLDLPLDCVPLPLTAMKPGSVRGALANLQMPIPVSDGGVKVWDGLLDRCVRDALLENGLL